MIEYIPALGSKGKKSSVLFWLQQQELNFESYKTVIKFIGYPLFFDVSKIPPDKLNEVIFNYWIDQPHFIGSLIKSNLEELGDD